MGWWICRSTWRYAWSCTWRTNLKPFRLRTQSRRQNSRRNNNIFSSFTCSVWTCSWMPGSAWRSAWSCTGLSSRRTDPKLPRLRPTTWRRNNRQNSDVFKCRPYTCSVWTCSWMRGSAWRSAWSCTGPFSRRIDPKPLRLHLQSRRRKRRQNSDVFKCRPFTCSV